MMVSSESLSDLLSQAQCDVPPVWKLETSVDPKDWHSRHYRSRPSSPLALPSRNPRWVNNPTGPHMDICVRWEPKAHCPDHHLGWLCWHAPWAWTGGGWRGPRGGAWGSPAMRAATRTGAPSKSHGAPPRSEKRTCSAPATTRLF